MEKIKTIILANEIPDDHYLWVTACDDFKEKVEYRTVNLTSNNWLEEIQSRPFDILLAKPGGLTSRFKQLYDERIFILERSLSYKIYPCAEEIFIYENKRFLSYWLKANKIPHPRTDVFYNRKEAEGFLSKNIFPVVAKTNLGASGSGVRILKTKQDTIKYLNQAFSDKGAPKRSGPNLTKGDLIRRGVHYLKYPGDIIKKASLYNAKRTDSQNGFVIFQKYIPHDFEWRVVRIGDSFFAHKKLKIGEKASGSLLKSYVAPPLDLLNFIKEITDRHKFYSQAVDVFESGEGYLVNEMQCIFGQSDPFQMLVNETPGRYLFINNNWIFESGSFSENACYNLRIAFIIEKLSKNIQ